MLLLSKQLIDQPVISLQTGQTIAITRLPIIDPRSLKIVGWWCTDQANTQHVLLTTDVRETSHDGMLVNDHSALSNPDELARHREILEINFEPINKLVKTKSRKLGRVTDYCYDEGYMIQKIYVGQSIAKAIGTETLIISRTQIIEISDEHIIVRDLDNKESDAVQLPGLVGKLFGSTN